jgi:hypothetical protein
MSSQSVFESVPFERSSDPPEAYSVLKKRTYLCDTCYKLLLFIEIKLKFDLKKKTSTFMKVLHISFLNALFKIKPTLTQI